MRLLLACIAAANLAGPAAAAPGGRRLRVRNLCASQPMWIAHEGGGGGVGPDPQNIKISPMQAHDFATFDGLASMRYWPKMACDEHGDHCGLGGSGGPGQSCVVGSGPAADYSHCAPPIDTKFEATFGRVGAPCNPNVPGQMAGCDYVDMSLVDGYTLPFKLDINGACSGKDPRPVNVIDCSGLSFERCPAGEPLGAKTVSLKAINPHTGLVAGCYGPCMKLIDAKWNNTGAQGHHAQEPGIAPYCCTTPPVTPEQCSAGPVKNTAYVNGVHAMCPGVYGYSYDDGMGLMRCQAGTAYQLTFFCPSVMPRQPGREPASPPAVCEVGAEVHCPGTKAICAGTQCCSDGSTCPSAADGFEGCKTGKQTDCTKPQQAPTESADVERAPAAPSAAASPKPAGPTRPAAPPAPAAAPRGPVPPASPPCSIGGRAVCPGTGAVCTGNQCCPDHTTCPAAAPDFRGCHEGKARTCSRPHGVPPARAVPAAPARPRTKAKPVPRAAQTCRLGQKVQCPGSPGTCTGNQCCPDGSTCPSAGNDFISACKHGKREDCLRPSSVLGVVVRRFDAEAGTGSKARPHMGLGAAAASQLCSAVAAMGLVAAAAFGLRRRGYQRVPACPEPLAAALQEAEQAHGA